MNFQQTLMTAATQGGGAAPAVTLAALSLDNLTIAEDQPTGTKVGTIINATSGSTVTLQSQSNTNMFAKDGNDIEVGSAGLDYATAPSPTVTLRETLAGATNTPRDSVITITVTEVIPSFASWPALVGDELMINGDCSSATGWVLGAGVAIALGKMTMTAASSDTNNDGVFALVAGADYRCAFTVDTLSLGTVQVAAGTGQGTVRSTTGTFSQDLNTGDGGDWILTATGATMQLDNFSVKSVGLLGVAADWSLFGDVSFVAGALVFGGGGATASLTGSAQTAFDAGVTDVTDCSVTLSADAAGIDGTLSVALKGGSPVSFVFDATPGQQVTNTVTSGSGSGFDLSGGGGIGASVRVQITLA
jgi:hypothetical protein